MFHKNAFVTIAVITLSLSSGCTTRPVYQGVKYDTRDAALEAQRDDLNTLVSKINPTNHPVGGRALVVLPTREFIRKRYVITKGVWWSDSRRAADVEFVATSGEISHDSYAMMIEKRRIFDQISVTKSDEPENVTSLEHDFVLCLTFRFEDKGEQWYLRASSSNEVIPISLDKSLPAGMPRVLSVLDAIESAATNLLVGQVTE